MSTLWAVIARDKPDAEPRRLAVRAAHFAYVETIADCIAVAGPLRTASGGFAGSVLIYHAADEAAARALLEADPYWRADIWEVVTVEPFTAAIGTWIGGTALPQSQPIRTDSVDP